MAISVNLKHSRVKIPSKEVKKKLKKIASMPLPSFASHIVDHKSIAKAKRKYGKYKNYILVGNGGSMNNFLAFYIYLLQYRTKKNVYMITTMEPDYLNQVKKLCSKKDSLVIGVSKSGTTVGQLEATFGFEGYKKLFITGTDKSVLQKIAEVDKNDMLEHPPIGGRFSGRTSCALAPAAIIGADAKGIDNGAKAMYKTCGPDVPFAKNPALQLAATLYQLYSKGYTEIFSPFYSMSLVGFLPQLIQLIHESAGKKGRGPTVFGDKAPESQHHTNQRFFGGKKNVCGLIFTVDKQDDKKSKIKINSRLKNLNLRNGKLGDLDGLHFASGLDYEFQGTFKNAIKDKKPVIVVSVDKISPRSCGELTALLQYMTVYLCMFLEVNPFDQPQVEYSKSLTFSMIKRHKR